MRRNPLIAQTSAKTRFQRLKAALLRVDARLPITMKLVLPIVVLGIVVGSAMGYVLYQTEADRIRSDFESRAVIITRSLEIMTDRQGPPQTKGQLIADLQAHLDVLARSELSVLLLNAYAVQDGELTLVASSDPGRVRIDATEADDLRFDREAYTEGGPVFHDEMLGDSAALEVNLPLDLGGEAEFVIGAYFSTVERDEALSDLLWTFVIGAGGSTVLAILALIVALHFLVVARLRGLLVATKRIQAGDFETRVVGSPSPDARDELVCLAAGFNSMADAIQTLQSRLKRLATTDEVTGLHNRRYIVESLEEEIYRARRREQQVGVIMLDIDSFKSVNDGYGHDVGDDVLRKQAILIQGAIRAGDIVARFGGDEFLVLLADCDGDALIAVLDRIREDTEELGTVKAGDAEVEFTSSAGGALMEPGDTPEELVRRADQALLRAKRAGRDQVQLSEGGLAGRLRRGF